MSTVKSKKPYLSVILPVYNEEENIEMQYKKLLSAIKPLKITYEIIFVDDGSTDLSIKILRTIAKKDKNIKLIIFRKNFGQTGAMAAGIDYSTGEIIVFMDSDLQNEPEDIGKLIDKLNEGYDVVSGWRKNRKDKMASRKIPSFFANKIISKVTGIKLHDLGCSLKAYRGEILRKVHLYGEMHRFIPVHASWIGARITEIPVRHHERKHGKSKYGIQRTYKVLLDLITVKFLGSYSTKPIYIFGGTGLLLLFLSFISGLSVILMKIFFRANITGNPIFILTVLLVIMSVLFIQIGILAEILIRIYHESQDMPPYHVRETLNFTKSNKR